MPKKHQTKGHSRHYDTNNGNDDLVSLSVLVTVTLNQHAQEQDIHQVECSNH